ncbi:hypothetical protein BC831DRAFT_476113 [Entophlyctis helioformis]|nr:hypothetical protein BC831DRAFT_476113 [Entophlyctis helioformis]
MTADFMSRRGGPSGAGRHGVAPTFRDAAAVASVAVAADADDYDEAPRGGGTAARAADAVRFTSAHHMFLQGLMSRQVMTVPEATELVSRIKNSAREHAHITLQDLVAQINASLPMLLDLQVKKAFDPLLDVDCFALVNLSGDELAKLSTAYTVAEVNFLKTMVNLMITDTQDGDFELSSLRALREAGQLRPAIGKQDADAFITRLVEDKWLINRNGLLSIGGVGDYVSDCSCCHQIVTVDGSGCSSPGCNGVMHIVCANKIFAHRPRKCLLCANPWPTTPVPVRQKRRLGQRRVEEDEDEAGEDMQDVQTDEEEEEEQNARVRTKRESGMIDLKADVSNDDEGDNEEEMEDCRPKASASKPRSRGRKAAASARDDSADEDNDEPVRATQRRRKRN